ncbi:type II secretion system F family protein [Algisphaera agarilytica]|uniref:General secretion pathway protein F n=1 Tax=Algisphaera agarilytica TaxID=1385975 RepID=A0A7X0LLJ7_9BACT|nr:type II secretion system F family protein [Algisphaera agarilytica]MBB6430038.1 type IV pilus assembly protein PilC [Algisphaera agarilytica]
MPDFVYKVRTAAGELTTGMITAASIADAGGKLRSDGMFIVKLDPSRGAKSKEAGKAKTASASTRVPRPLIIAFAHQLAVMVDTGVPISEALHCIADQCDSAEFKLILEDVASQVEAGGELSTALGRFPKVFPTIMVSLVRASEVSGTMGVMLERISNYMGKEYQTQKKIKGAMTYPAVMLAMVLTVTVGLLVWVLPRFATIFESKGAALPLPTRMLMFISDSLMLHWYLWVGGTVALVVGFVVGMRTHAGRRVFDRVKLSSPIFGDLFSKLYVTRSTRTMGTMINAGVPVLDMIAIVKDVTRNALYEDLWETVDDRLRQGAQLSDALFDSPLIPRSVAQMIYAGEKSGRLGQTMEKIAGFTEEEFDEQIKTTTNLIEPTMVAIMGGIVGFVAIALLLPIFSVSSVVGS